MDERLYNPAANNAAGVVDEDWYQTADAIFKARMADYQSYGQPGGYASYMQEVRKYKSNLDPLETMGYLNVQRGIDSNWEYAQNLGKSIYNGSIGVVRDTLNGIRAARDYNIAMLNERAKAEGFERNTDQDFVNALDNAAKAEVLQPFEVKQSASAAGQFGLDLAQGAGQLVGQMAVSIPAEAVAPGIGGLAMMVGQITGGQYENLKAKGVDTKRAAEAAFINGLIQAPFERIGLTKLMKRIPANTLFKKKLQNVMEKFLAEGVTEAIQQFPEEWSELWALNPDKSWKELQTMAAKKFPDTLQNALYAGLIGGILGAGAGGIHIAIDRNIDLALRKELHDERVGAIESRINHIKQSGISPDYAGETVNANLNNATVLIDGGTLNAYAQRVGEEKAAEKLGVTVEEIREAAEKGDTVEVKQGNFEALSASDPSFYQEVRDDLSFDAKDMSNRKYDTIQANVERYSKIGEKQRTELKAEVDKIAATMEEAGVPKGQIAGMKAMLTSFATAMRPDNPAQFIRDNALRFERGVKEQVNFRSNEEKANLVKDILDTNFDNPREEIENRIKTIDKEIEMTPAGSEHLPILKAHRDILTSLLENGDADVPAIERYKQRYNRDNGTFDNTYHQSGQNKMSALVINPTKQRTTDSLMNYEKLSIDNIKKRDPGAFGKIIAKVKKIPGLGVKDATDEETYQHMKKRVAANLVWLYKLVTDPEDRKRAKLWYEGGHKMIKSWADRYGISEMAGAGAMAVLSPQKDWFMNVNMTERILDIMFADRFKPWTQEMTEIARLGKLKKDGTREDPIVTPQARGVDPNMPALDRAEGKTLDELLRNRDYYAAAIWIRVYDEVYNSEEKFGENNRGYKILTPEGGTGDYVRTQSGDKSNMAWQGYGNIAKAVSIIANPSYTNVSLQLGTNHKVRNFFNNLYNPNELDFATIDTHAVAAAALMPYSASSEAVNENFGTISSADSGASGTYAFFLEAYRDAADEVGISAREMQSITWEMVRILFTDTFKKDVKLKDENGNYIIDEKTGKPKTGPNENVLAIQKLWEEADKAINEYDGPDKEEYEKNILAETRKNVYYIVDKVKPVGKFAWHDTEFQPEVGDTYNRSRVQLINSVGVDNKLSRTQISVEVAPDPNNKVLSALWDGLEDADKEKISKEVAETIINLVLNEFDSDAVFSVQVGGYEGKTNPSLNISVDKPELAVPIAKMLGYALNQDSMFITSYAPFMGARKSKGVAINVGTMDIEGARQLYDKLYTITNKAGNPAVTGYSLSDGVVTIIFDEESNGMTVDELIDKIVEITPEYDNEIRSVEVYMATPQRVRKNADTDIYGYLPPLPQMETQEALKAKARDIVADRKARGIKATIKAVTEELIKEQEDRLKAVKQQWVDILLPEIQKENDAVLTQKVKELAEKENISNEDAMKRVLDEQDAAIAKRNKEREEMLNAESITKRVDWSVATLDRRADYIRSQAEAAIQGGISEAQRPKDDGNANTEKHGEGPAEEGGTPAGSGQLLGQETPGTGDRGRGNLNQETYQQGQQESSQIKGSFDPFADGEAVIKLFEGADASTVIHETGHYYIESMWREIAAGRATEQQKADFEKLMKYCGITTAQWAKMDLEGRRAAHERLAEAIETYVMEDKAPTRELRPVFKRFAKWLKAVYSAISRNRNAVPLTDEVREVFDRMLASEEDVEQMRRVEGYFEKLPSVITDNLSDATKKRIEDYILKAQDKAVEILTKERLANFSEERKREIENFRNMISDDVRQEVANRPLYVAARQAQELLGGEKPASAKQYANLYLEEKMGDENEVKWEIVAEQNNMSPSELAQKLLEEPSENEAYEAAMNEAVQKEFPDYYTEREQAEEATRQAMYNDESGILLGVEQTLIEDFAARAAAQQRSAETARKLAMAKRQQAKVAAQKELANMKLKDAIRVDRFIAAERRCAVKSAEAMAKKDYDTAKQYKDMQAFNHACVIESANLRKRKQQYDKLLRRLFRAKRETWTSEQHFNQAMQLFARMGLMNPQYDPTTRTQSLVDYVNEMSEIFYPFNEIPDWLADETWPITDPKNMRFEDYEKVIDLMRYIKTMAKVEKAANFCGSNSTYQEWRDQAMDNLNKLATKFAPILGEKQTASWIDKFQAAFQTLDNFLEKMDGWHFGFFSRTFGDAIKHANDNEFAHIEAYQKRKAEIEQAWCPDDKALAEKSRDIYYEELGTSASKFVLTKMLMNLGNEGNARKLCSSYPSEALRNSSLWVFENGMLSKDEAIAQTKENLLEFLGRVLTKEDIAYAQAKIDLAGMYWGEMADLDRRTKGFTPKKVEAYPVTITLANGEEIVFQGGYFPLIRNGEMGSHPVGILPVSETDARQGKNVRTMYTDTGHMKARVEAEYPVDLTEGSEDRAMRAAIHDLCWRETMTDFRRILNDQFMFGLMKSKLGIADMTAFREMLEHAAQPDGGASMAMGEGLLATTAGWLRRKTVNSIVMLNLRINLQNFGNLFLYGNTVEGFGYSDVLGAMGNAFSKGFEGRSFFEMWDFVDQKSAFMRQRSETPDITLADLRDEGKLNKYEREAMKWGARAMMYTDGFTARPVWMQAYTKKINAGATEQEAIDFADTIIRRTLGSGRVTDVSSLQRGGPVYKLFTAFQGFFNTQFNQWMREYNIDRRLWSEKEYKEMALRITSFVASKYLAACFFNLVFALQNPFADDDDDEYSNYTTELLHYPMSLVGIYGPVAKFAMDKTLGIKAYSYRMSIIESSLDKVYRASGKMGKMIDGDFEAGLEGLTDVAGIAAGVPAQMNRLFWNAYDIFVNGMDPRLEDLATRRPKRERK